MTGVFITNFGFLIFFCLNMLSEEKTVIDSDNFINQIYTQQNCVVKQAPRNKNYGLEYSKLEKFEEPKKKVPKYIKSEPIVTDEIKEVDTTRDILLATPRPQLFIEFKINKEHLINYCNVCYGNVCNCNYK